MPEANSKQEKQAKVSSDVSARETLWLIDEDVNRPIGYETRNGTMRSVDPTKGNSQPRYFSRGSVRLVMVAFGGILVRLVGEVWRG
jgi:hypothetical protein